MIATFIPPDAWYNRLFLTIFLALFFSAVCAQPFIKVFSLGSASFQFDALGRYSDKGWIATGSVRDNSDIYSLVSRFDSSGNLVWTKRPEYSRSTQAIVALGNGDILLFNNNFGLNQYFDASVLMLDANGNFKKEIVWGTPNDQEDWIDARKTPDGGVLAVGYSRLETGIIFRIMVARFSASGQVLWEKMFNAPELLGFSKIVPLESGGFFLLGDTYDFMNRGILILRCAEDGGVLWSREYKRATLEESVIDGISLGNDEIMVATYLSTDTVFGGTTGLLRFNASGAITRQTLISNAQGMAPLGLGWIGNDTLAMAALSSPVLFPPVDGDLILATFTKDGDLTGSIAFGTDKQDFGTDVIFLDGEAIFSGLTDSSLTGTAQRGFISKANPRYSCCRKSVQLDILPTIDLPVATDYPLALTQNTVKQTITASMSNVQLAETVSCLSFEATNILPADTTICVGNGIELRPILNLPGTYSWSTGANMPAILVDTPGEYSVTIRSECGLFKDTILVGSKGAIPDITASPDTTICAGTSVLLSASGGIAYAWQDTDGAILSGNNSLVVEPDISAVYSVVISIGDCSDTASVAVTVLSLPVVTATPDTLVPLGAVLSLRASGASSYVWTPPGGLSCTGCPNPVLVANEATIYVVTGLDANGCSDTASVKVEVKKPCPVYIPNIFTPGNALGQDNGIFRVYGSDIRPEGFMLRIYSRWGELVFQSEDTSAFWDGQVRGKEAGPGVYTYFLEMNNCDGIVRKSGDITLIR